MMYFALIGFVDRLTSSKLHCIRYFFMDIIDIINFV